MTPIIYDRNYFDPESPQVKHAAGYSQFIYEPDDQIMHQRLFELFSSDFVGKKVLELGCAKGYLVKFLSDQGVDIVGIEGSEWALSQSVMPQKTLQGNFPACLSEFADNSFDTLIALRILPCFTDSELPELVSEIGRISSKQILLVDDASYYLPNELEVAETYYNVKTLEEWQQVISSLPNAYIERVVRFGVNGSEYNF